MKLRRFRIHFGSIIASRITHSKKNVLPSNKLCIFCLKNAVLSFQGEIQFTEDETQLTFLVTFVRVEPIPVQLVTKPHSRLAEKETT